MILHSHSLSEQNFQKFGKAYYIKTDQRPNTSGEGWDCFVMEMEDQSRHFFWGIVVSQPKNNLVKFMEKHQNRIEYVIALNHPVIQVVSLGDPERENLPNESQVEAFLIKPGQMVRINRGVWHSVAFPETKILTKYLFIVEKPPRNYPGHDNVLIELSKDLYIKSGESTTTNNIDSINLPDG